MYIFYALLNLMVGMLMGLLTTPNERGHFEYRSSLTPPGYVFSIAWTTIYLGTALSALDNETRKDSDYSNYWKFCVLYFTQFILQHIWVVSFFVLKLYLLSGIIMIALIYTVYLMYFKYQCESVKNKESYSLRTGLINLGGRRFIGLFYLGWLFVASLLLLDSIIQSYNAGHTSLTKPVSSICEGTFANQIISIIHHAIRPIHQQNAWIDNNCY